MILDIGIITCAHRSKLAYILKNKLEHEDVRITVYNDFSMKGLWWNAHRTWLASWKSPASYYMVMTEDAVVCKDFTETILKLLQKKPDAFTPYNRFTGTRSIKDTWRICQWPINGLANICSIEIARNWVLWADATFKDEFWSDDARYYSYLESQGITNRMIIPGLCQHMWWLESLEIKKHGILKADRFIGENESGLSLDIHSGYDVVLNKSQKGDYSKWLK